jgi:signal peptidase II
MAMPSATNKKLFLFFPLAIFALFLDQASKIYFNTILTQPISLLGDFFSLRIEHNVGMAFSLTLPYPLQLTLNLVFFAGLVVYLFRQLDLSKSLSQIILAILVAGALGNILDRLRLGYVVDFISIGSFPVFNLADSFITVSIFLLMLFYDKIKRTN